MEFGHLEKGNNARSWGLTITMVTNYLHPSWDDPPSGFQVDLSPSRMFAARKVLGSMGYKLLYTSVKTNLLDGGFKYFLFSPLLGEDSHFD